MIKSMTFTNSRGDTFSFGRHFRLIEGFDMSNLTANVNYSQSTDDGANYQNTKLNNREFDIGFRIDKVMRDAFWIEEQRQLLFKVFNPKCNPIRIDFTTFNNEEYYLNANLESAPSLPGGNNNNNPAFQRGLLQFSANDPFIYRKDEQRLDIALWVPAFEFPLEIPEEGIEMGYRSPSLIVNVINEGQESTGMKIRFKALGTLVNPSLFNADTREQLLINTTMLSGDIIEVSTYKRRKFVKLIRNGVETNIFNLLDLSSKFLQLNIGDNLFRYDAAEGLGNLEVSIIFTPVFLGV